MLEGRVNRRGRTSILDRYGSKLRRIVDHQQAEQVVAQGMRLQRLDALMRNVVENSFDGILTIREDGGIETANDAALRLFGYPRNAIQDCQIGTLLPNLKRNGGDMAGLFQLGYGHREVTGRRRDGSNFPLDLAISDTRLNEDRVFIAIVRDISERHLQQEQLRHQALHDSLTGLPNRTLLVDRIDHALEAARRDRQPQALILLDLDRFKEINDTLGHHVGDMVLADLARRLVQPIRESDTIARLGGDEFAVLLPAVSDLERAQRVAERIFRSLDGPFEVEGLKLEVGVSIGIAMYPEHAEDTSRLLQCADVAMYAAKKGHSHIALYDAANDHNSVRHLPLRGELRHAIENETLLFHYQPKIDLKTRRTSSVEALARWEHPEHGFIPPTDFILQAERTGLIQPLSLWAFNTALSQLAEWRGAGLDIGMAVNLSTRTLQEDNLPDLLEELLQKWQVEAHHLTLEITESAIMVDPDRAMSVARRLDAIGLRLSIDDFGTGYSSLAYLKRLPVHELKIDRSFVMQMADDENDAVIVRSTIDLAHNLGLQVVAEGIECERHIDLLADLNCDVGQGYFISYPLPGPELATWMLEAPWRPAQVDEPPANAAKPAE